MKKINKQLYIRMILPVALMFVAFAVVIVMAATQPDGKNHPAYVNILGIAGFIIPLSISLVLLIKLYGKSMVVSMILKELRELKRNKDYYFGCIDADTPKKYLDTIAGDFLSSGYKDYTSEINLRYDDYRFFLRKHFWKLDSTNIHTHLATVSADSSKIREFFDDIANKEIELNYGKFRGSYCGIIAVCIVEEFSENDEFFAFFDDIVFVRGIAVVRVLVDVKQNRVFISRGGAITGTRGKRVVKKFILRTKSLKKCPGYFGKNNEMIEKLEKKLDNMDFKNLFEDAELSEKQKDFINSLRDGEVGFQGNTTAEEGGIIVYKEGNKILYLFCDYDEDDKTFGIIGIDEMKWNVPKKIRIIRKQKQEITEKIIQYLNKNNIPYTFIEMFFSKENQTILLKRDKK